MSESSAEPSALELIAAIARSLVDKPEAVSVHETSNEVGTVLRLRVDPSDVGKVIGKQGRTARSLRTILEQSASNCTTVTALKSSKNPIRNLLPGKLLACPLPGTLPKLHVARVQQ